MRVASCLGPSSAYDFDVPAPSLCTHGRGHVLAIKCFEINAVWSDREVRWLVVLSLVVLLAGFAGRRRSIALDTGIVSTSLILFS